MTSERRRAATSRFRTRQSNTLPSTSAPSSSSFNFLNYFTRKTDSHSNERSSPPVTDPLDHPAGASKHNPVVLLDSDDEEDVEVVDSIDWYARKRRRVERDGQEGIKVDIDHQMESMATRDQCERQSQDTATLQDCNVANLVLSRASGVDSKGDTETEYQSQTLPTSPPIKLSGQAQLDRAASHDDVTDTESTTESSHLFSSHIFSEAGGTTDKPNRGSVASNTSTVTELGDATLETQGTDSRIHSTPSITHAGVSLAGTKLGTKPVSPSGSVATMSASQSLGRDLATEDLLAWDDGDDEGMGMEDADLDASAADDALGVDEGLAQDNPTGASINCPICGAGLDAADANLHVDQCLDKPVSDCVDKSTVDTRLTNVRDSMVSKHTPPRRISSIVHTVDSSPEPDTTIIENGKPTSAPNAFSLLMTSHKERDMWKDALSEEKRDGSKSGPRKAPFYKVLTGMPIAVDAFCYGAIPKVTAYFLTHAHSDHYTTLSKSWKHGPIYCSETTANLIVHKLGVEPQWVRTLPDDEPFEIPDTGGVTVTSIEANHCPGSSIFLFEGCQTVNAGDSTFHSPFVGSRRKFRFLHCGDFRACPKHVLHPAVARGKVDTVYLDTTYLNPTYCFPPQPLVIAACAELARKVECDGAPEGVSVNPTNEVEDTGDIKPDISVQIDTAVEAKPDTKPESKLHSTALAFGAQLRSAAMMEGWLKKDSGESEETKPKGRLLVVIGTYSIGKERIVKGIAQALGSKIYCDPRKRGILACQADPELHSMLEEDPLKAQVHLVPLQNISLDRLQPYLAALPSFARVLAFRPTGWTYTPPAGSSSSPDLNHVIRRDQALGFSDVSLKPIRGSSRKIMMFGVPYSEHSSFFELTCFALSLPGEVRIVATVNVNSEKSRAKMKMWFDKWAAEKAKRKAKGLPAVVEYRDESYW